MDLRDLREDYSVDQLHKKDLIKNPFEQFKEWLKEAQKSNIKEATAMSLSTVNSSGQPSSRMVLLKELDDDGFIFYTNYQSRKGKEILNNSAVALLFFWDLLERQVRIEGQIEKISLDKSDQYFAQRPIKSQIGAIASPQSEVIASREWLEEKFENESQSEGATKRPEHWGGYIVKPSYFEFWQGRRSRLHDRFAFNLNEEKAWNISRLAP